MSAQMKEVAQNVAKQKLSLGMLSRVESAADCQAFLVGVLTTPGFLDQALQLIKPNGEFFSDAMAEDNLEAFVRIQQGFILDLIPDFTILNWRYGLKDGNNVVVKFQATASHCGIPFPAGDKEIPASGARCTWTCVWIFTLEDGKVARLEKSFDRGSFHHGLGLPAYDVEAVQPKFRPN